MWRWTFKSLVASPLTLAMSIAAAACAMLLAILFEAIYAGEAKQVVAYLENADADVWVMQGGVSNMHMATSYLSDWKAHEVRDVDGVASVESILYLNTVRRRALVDGGGQADARPGRRNRTSRIRRHDRSAARRHRCHH
jgi:hypothetical protein